ncbi:MAG: NAD(P)-dependent oxidoreductase [Bacteroidetes bacterium HGW-Bacteroidetes-4]|jgi:NAD(P)H dehydrogenase (quinone)|nr:MAG: NAD(P)-dependent oxidoreductase [Bacteroidetes bacterium HGW-Bacteroidetes-4]
MKTLIAGSTGNLGSATIDFLIKKNQINNIVALARNEEKAQVLKAKGVEVRLGDYDDYASLLNATKGIDTMLLISSSEVAKSRAEQHINAIKAAKENGVKHIIYTGFLRTHDDPSSPLWFIAKDHVETENYLKESGISYTLFENGYYMDMLMGFVGEKILETKTLFVPAGNGKVNFVLRNEIAEALANVLTTRGHENKVYNIGNEQPVSFAEIAEIISTQSGESIQYVSPEPETYTKTLISYGVPEMWAKMSTAFAVAFAANTMNVPTTDLTKLLGRKPTEVKTYLSTLFSK